MKKNTKKHNDKLEQSITSYFSKAELEAGTETENSNDPDFEKERVYSNVLRIIERKQKKQAFVRAIKIAASLFLFASVSLPIYYYNGRQLNSADGAVMIETVAPRGKVIKVGLPDGSTVYLNAGSKLSYPKSFASGIRAVNLKGEGYFKVTHQPQRPFIIHTDKINTQVLGTSFNIRAYPEHEDIKVTVLAGKVGVYILQKNASAADTRLITANQQVVFSKTSNKLSAVGPIVNAAELVAWTEGKMVYNSQLLVEVIEDIERHYNIEIETPEQLNSCRITANFDHASLEKVLKVLAKLIDGEVKYKNGIYLLSGVGC